MSCAANPRTPAGPEARMETDSRVIDEPPLRRRAGVERGFDSRQRQQPEPSVPKVRLGPSPGARRPVGLNPVMLGALQVQRVEEALPEQRPRREGGRDAPRETRQVVRRAWSHAARFAKTAIVVLLAGDRPRALLEQGPQARIL